jgi:hypothetical protein
MPTFYKFKALVFFSLLIYVGPSLFQTACAQLYPVQSTSQLIPPYSVYLSDYAAPGNEKLRVILVQRDLTQPAYQLRLVMTVELNGKVILRTSRTYNPPPISLNPGIPTVISGAEIAPYLDSRNIDFVGYSLEQYEKTRALPEGSYQLTFTAYDYRRQDVQVSNAGTSFYYLAKNEPPLINFPACGAAVPMRTPQQIVFSWLARNTSSPNSAAETQYEFELFETRPAGRNPNDVVLSGQPVFKTTVDYTQLIYGPAEPLLLENIKYVWRVRAVDREGRDAFRNNGYSEVCTFAYGGVDPNFDIGIVKGLKAEGETERRAKIWWTTGAYDAYRVNYRKTGNGSYEWFTSEVTTQQLTAEGKTDGEVKLFDLEPDTEYETRIQGKKSGILGGYTEIVKFRTQPMRIAQCGDPTPLPKAPGNPYRNALMGETMNVDGMDLTLSEITNLGDGYYAGLGRVSLPYLGGASFAVKFSRIFINTDRIVEQGRIDFITKGVAAMVEQQLVNVAIKIEARKQPLEDFPEARPPGFFYDEILVFSDIEISSIATDKDGNVIVTDHANVAYSSDKFKAQLQNQDKALIVADKNGDQWIINKDKTVEKLGQSGSVSAANADIAYPYSQSCVEITYAGIYMHLFTEKEVDANMIPVLKKAFSTRRNIPEEDVRINAKDYKYEKGQVVYSAMPYKVKQEDDLKFTKTEKAEFKINNELIPITSFKFSDYEPKFIKGPNLLELTTTLNQPALVKKPKDERIQINFIYGISETENLRAVITRNKKEIKKKSGEYLGDENIGESPLKPGEELIVGLVELKDGAEIKIENLIVSYNGVTKKTAPYTISVSAAASSFTIQKDEKSEAITVIMMVDEDDAEEKAPPLPSNQLANVDVSDLDPKIQDKAKNKKYAKALADVQLSSPDVYRYIANDVPIAVHLLRKKNVSLEIKSSKGKDVTLNGFADKNVGLLPFDNTIYYNLLDIRKIEKIGKEITDAVLIQYLTTAEKEQIKIAAKQKEVTDLFNIIYLKIKSYSELYKASPGLSKESLDKLKQLTDLPELLKKNVLEDKIDQTMIDTLCYVFDKTKVKNVISYGKEVMHININYGVVGSDRAQFSETLLHEMKHIVYAMKAENHLNVLKWMVFRTKKDFYAKNPNKAYDLADELGANGHCSTGPGHEKHNPENAFVCPTE